jgi:hypothetical protein
MLKQVQQDSKGAISSMHGGKPEMKWLHPVSPEAVAPTDSTHALSSRIGRWSRQHLDVLLLYPCAACSWPRPALPPAPCCPAFRYPCMQDSGDGHSPHKLHSSSVQGICSV